MDGEQHPAPGHCLATGALLILALLVGPGCGKETHLEPWLEEELHEEFTAAKLGDDIRDFRDYLSLEQRLFREMDEAIYARTPTGPAWVLERYSRGSAADPARWPTDWNRSFERDTERPAGGVLLLHGMSDAPYSLRSLGETLHKQGFRVLGLRLPGHGTIPSGLRTVTWEDMAAAVRLGMAHLASGTPKAPLHIVGYSTGAALALDYAMDALERPETPAPASLILVSPAVRVHPAGALAGMKAALATLPGLDDWAYLSVMNEFDPFKYNSFATNAAAQVYRLTRRVERRVGTLAGNRETAKQLPPMLVLKSAVDATVTTEAVVDRLLNRLPAGRNELVLFDINRNAAIEATLLITDPGPLTRRLMEQADLPFTVTFVTNESPASTRVVARRKPPFTGAPTEIEPLGLSWPPGVVSLSHVALTFPPDDPLYGLDPPPRNGRIFLGDLAIKGERGLLRIPGDWLLRMRFNPFHSYLQTRILQWLGTGGAPP